VIDVTEAAGDRSLTSMRQDRRVAAIKQGLQSIPMFYSERMLAEAGSFSPSAGKPRHVRAAWQGAELPISVRPITPASEMDLCLAHDPAYVRGVLTTGQMIERDQIVFEAARVSETPIAWSLAVGYQSPLRKVLDLHDDTMRACAAAYVEGRPSG
jgi:hypothetical protein